MDSTKRSRKFKIIFCRILSQYIPLGLIIILLGIDICLHISDTVIKDDHIILVFVGILATFVVISNYAQVREVKDNFAKQVRDASDVLEKRFNDRILEYDNIMEGAIHVSYGNLSVDLGDIRESNNEDRWNIDLHYSRAFFSYVEALRLIERTKDKRRLTGLLRNMETFFDRGITMELTSSYKEEFIGLLNKCSGEQTLVRALLDYAKEIKTIDKKEKRITNLKL
jgi:hypothetical protein